MADETKPIQIELIKASVFEIDPKKRYLVILPQELFESSAQELGRSFKEVFGNAKGILLAVKDQDSVKVVEYDPSQNEPGKVRVPTAKTEPTTKNN